MSAPEFSLEPEVQAIIAEIARDPRSSFFKVERPQNPRNLLRSWEGFSARSAGWNAAERHLLDAHREEVAYWLRVKILLEGLELQDQPFSVDHHVSLDDRTELPARAAWRAHARNAVRTAPADGQPTDVLQRAILRDTWTPTALYDLSVVLTRTVPNDVAWLRLGWTMSMVGYVQSAIQLLGERLQVAHSGVMRGYLWENLGSLYALQKRHDRSREAHERAANLGETRVGPLASSLCQALMSEDTAASERACRILDERVDGHHPVLRQMMRYLERSRRARVWSPSTVAMRTAGSLMEGRGPASRVILHAFT